MYLLDLQLSILLSNLRLGDGWVPEVSMCFFGKGIQAPPGAEVQEAALLAPIHPHCTPAMLVSISPALASQLHRTASSP